MLWNGSSWLFHYRLTSRRDSKVSTPFNRCKWFRLYSFPLRGQWSLMLHLNLQSCLCSLKTVKVYDVYAQKEKNATLRNKNPNSVHIKCSCFIQGFARLLTLMWWGQYENGVFGNVSHQGWTSTLLDSKHDLI